MDRVIKSVEREARCMTDIFRGERYTEESKVAWRVLRGTFSSFHADYGGTRASSSNVQRTVREKTYDDRSRIRHAYRNVRCALYMRYSVTRERETAALRTSGSADDNYFTSSAKHPVARQVSRQSRPSQLALANVAIVILWPEAMNRQPYARLPQARIRTCVRRPAVTRRSNNARRNTRLYDNEAPPPPPPPPKLMPVRCETSRQNRSRYIRHLAHISLHAIQLARCRQES